MYSGGFPSTRGGARDSVQLSSDTHSTPTLSGWSNKQSTTANFEAGDRFIENTIPKEAFKFVVSHVETANQFYIQLLSKGAELTALSEVLQNEYKQSPEENLTSFKVNQPCLAKSNDGCWYRGKEIEENSSKK